MKQFDNIVNWKLLSGSHDFPGPDGGTCINEAAIVAAGFEYKSINSVDDCPPCFSRPISALAIALNDGFPDLERQRLLMPFVTRLAGTADTIDIEIARGEFMILEAVRTILADIISDIGDPRGRDLARIDSLEQINAFMRPARYGNSYHFSLDVGALQVISRQLPSFIDDLLQYAYTRSRNPSALAITAGTIMTRCAHHTFGTHKRMDVYLASCRILDQAIRMGKRTELDICDVAPRLEKAKADKVTA